MPWVMFGFFHGSGNKLGKKAVASGMPSSCRYRESACSELYYSPHPQLSQAHHSPLAEMVV